MRRLKSSLVIVVMLMSAAGPCGKSYAQQVLKPPASQTEEDKQILQMCREAALELKHKREVEIDLRDKVKKLEAANANAEEQIKSKDAAIASYEKAVVNRENAETLYNELKANHAQQMANAEKQLAIEKQKTGFWKIATVVAAALAAALYLTRQQ